MPSRSNLFNQPSTLPITGALFAALFWVVDSAIDAWVFEEKHTFFESLLSPEPVEFWMRLLVIVLMIALATYAKRMLILHYRNTDELNHYKDNLERLVDERTSELRRVNERLKEEIAERERAERELERLATTDPLTQLYNRRKFEELLDYEIERGKRFQSSLSFIFCDIDRFKRINDEYGHDTGDMVLRAFSKILKSNIRASNILARWGGEEFVLFIPNASADIATGIAEKLRIAVSTHDFPVPWKVTASFGVTQFIGNESRNAALKRADNALYSAKEKGRNRTEVRLG